MEKDRRLKGKVLGYLLAAGLFLSRILPVFREKSFVPRPYESQPLTWISKNNKEVGPREDPDSNPDPVEGKVFELGN